MGQRREGSLERCTEDADTSIRSDGEEADEKRRADENQMAQINAVTDQAQIQADKELALKEMELKAQAQASISATVNPTPHHADAKSPKLPAFVDEKDELDSYLYHFEHYAKNASWEKNTWAIKLSAIDMYTRMSNEDANGYDKLKKALGITLLKMATEGDSEMSSLRLKNTSETSSSFD